MQRSNVFVAGAALAGSLVTGRWAWADCYVDSIHGSDANDGMSATTPVQSQSAIPSGCGTVRYARGSQFNEAMQVVSGATTYTNYGDSSSPLPDFKLPVGTGTSVFETFDSGITIDGIKLEGAHNTSGSLSGLGSGGGICVYLLGSNDAIQNSEVTDCDFGIMLSGSGGLATHNYVHDILGEAVDGEAGVDPNSVGGSKGIYAMASNCEVSYNTIVNCVNYPQWTGANGSSKGGCDGGATEIAVGQSGGTLTGYKNHHNFAYNTCGFFQASTVAGNNGNGTFSNSLFYDNVMIDTAWMILAQVNNTNFVNMRWENNTVVQHQGAGPTADQGLLMEMWNGYSSGVSGGSTPANQIFLTNNLMVLEGVEDVYDFNASWSGGSLAVNTNIVLTSNIFLNNTSLNPGFVHLGDGMSVPNATDFDLTSDTVSFGASNPTIDQGTAIAGLTLDFLNRLVPSPTTGKVDIGAFEYGSVTSDAGPPAPTPGDSGAEPAGGTDGASSGDGTEDGATSISTSSDMSVASAGGSSSLSSADTADASAGRGSTTGNAGGNAAAHSDTTSGGCGCRVGGAARGSAAWTLGLFALGARRRRRRAPSQVLP